MNVKNMDLAAERIRQSVEKGEQVVLYGDSDLDGVSSVVIIKESIENLLSLLPDERKKDYPKILAYFPQRQSEGYGLNDKALAFIKTQTKGGLLITLDCGITNYDEVADAKQSGFSVIIVDHHLPIGGRLPVADIVIDPKQPGDDFLFKEYANAGLAFKLAEEILKEKMSPMLRQNFLELTALATIADMMPETDENQTFIFEGLADIENSRRPAIQALRNLLRGEIFNSTRDLVSKINGLLNSSRMENHITFAYTYLTEPDIIKAKKMAKELLQEHESRQKEVYSLTENIKAVISESPGTPFIFMGSANWNIEFLGAVASRVSNFFDKPVFLYQKYDDFSRGTVRVPKGYDAVKAMETCKELLRTFGGHPPAAGFTVVNKNLEKFEACLKKYFNNLNLE
ncbi:MAG: DHH family phosphoesterase [Candidatus Pacebacteria bacterium]|nr:DHH family phosphoesterase [Candidatus Paceibacterota bacterium]